MEFLADSTSLLEVIFNLLYIILNFIDSFYADYSLGKRLFLFKEMENKDFDIFKKHQKIKELIEKTEPFIGKGSIIIDDSRKKFSKFKNKEYPKYPEKDMINIYNIKNGQINEKKEKIQLYNDCSSEKVINISKNKSANKNIKLIEVNSEIQSNLNNNKIKISSNKIYSQKKNKIEAPKFKIDNFYNIFEIFISTFLYCFMSKNLRIKKDLKLKSNHIIYNKLDIILYIKNMILLDIMTVILLDGHNKNIIKFLSYPILTMNEEEEENKKFYEKYSEDDFNKFYDEISDLSIKNEALEKDKKLIIMTNQKLKQLI